MLEINLDLTGFPEPTAEEHIAETGNPHGAKLSDLENDCGFINEETDPTVPSWAKAPQKPSYTAAEVRALPLTGGTMAGNIALEKVGTNPQETYKLIFRRTEGNEYETRMDVRNDVLRVYTYDKNNNLSFPFQVDLKSKSVVPTESGTIVTGAYMAADDAAKITDSTQSAYCYPLGNRTWFVRLHGKFTTSSDSYYGYGIDISKIAAALGKANSAFAVSGNYANTYRLWDYETGTEKTNLYGLWSLLDCINGSYLRPARCYTVASGSSLQGAWGLSSLPAKAYIMAEFYMKAW